ncbi:MAG: ATP-binding protein [Chitinophagaceae bacterium]|nr:ATP-binding protein [Chitinophagaceae bacterium]
MKKCLFILVGLCFVFNAIAQFETKLPFAETIKISAKDSLTRINPEAKNQLAKIAEAQSRQKKTKPIRLFFNSPKNDENNKMGKFMAAHLEQDLYKVSLSTVISKYIGETEKNLDKVFEAATNSNLILFFDEADALFGKRTTVKDSHDKYANQEVSYFMSLIKQFKGTVFIKCNKSDCIESVMLQTFTKVGG